MTNVVILSSFKASPEYVKAGWTPFSVAVYQPAGFSYPKLPFFDIRNGQGKWNRPRDFVGEPEPLVAYKDALLSLYTGRTAEIQPWVASAPPTSILCCWCPYDRAAQRQLKEYGTFVCHTEIVGLYLRNSGVIVVYDADRMKMVKFD